MAFLLKESIVDMTAAFRGDTPFSTENVSGIICEGGTILKTARSKEFMTKRRQKKGL